MEEELIALLEAAISWRISWGSLGDGDGLPRAAIFRTGGDQDHTQRGPGLVSSRIQIDCYGATAGQAIGAAREVQAVLSGYRGGAIKGAFLKLVRDDERKDVSILARRSLIFSIVHRD
ncbi:hypothetical protein [Mameliella sediminis]|uniref:hypothetical protein n=1 Tax=Mameliella sediminis TaxID=2836866 RepID=UPI001C494FBD|nr:hypothetical protein [Mameliella sediminis]MBV7394556.1 hypothetical protein [Mameliella sediminis]